MPTIDLTEPATTDAQTLVARMSVGKHANKYVQAQATGAFFDRFLGPARRS